jgi:hypothetical protein
MTGLEALRLDPFLEGLALSHQLITFIGQRLQTLEDRTDVRRLRQIGTHGVGQGRLGQ